MSILGVNGALAGAYRYANRTQKTGTNKTGFMEQLQKTGEAADTSKVDAYPDWHFRFFALIPAKRIPVYFITFSGILKEKNHRSVSFRAFCSQPYCKEMHGGNPAFCYWACVFFFPSLAVTFCSCHSPF